MKYRVINLEYDYRGVIFDFSLARNSFLETLPDDEYILWYSKDEEITIHLLQYLKNFLGTLPYYAIRRINLSIEGEYLEWANPEYSPHLVSNKVRYVGKIHEHLEPRKPYGIIGYPIIHYTGYGSKSYNAGWKTTPLYRPVLALKKSLEIMKGR